MSFRFKIDEDLPSQVATTLIERGHDAKTVVEQGWQGFPDATIWQALQGEARWLVTGDKGFADLRTYTPGTHAGVMLLRPEEESRRAYVQLIDAALKELDLDAISGATVVVTHRGVRIRRPERH